MSDADLAVETRRVLDAASAAFPPLGTSVTDAVEARRLIAAARAGAAAGRQVARVLDREVPGPDAAPPVPVRCYWPRETTEALPVVVFIHGGGFVLCDLDTHDGTCRALCAEADAVVVSVGYRLAPEAPYPAALDDCDAVLSWAAESAAELGGDATRIAVAGDSAGGNLAAALCLRRRDDRRPMPSHQLLFYPVLDARQSTDSYRHYAQGYFLTAAHMRWYWQCYLADADPLGAYTSPGLASDVSGLPPAVIVAAGCDPLHDEAVAYAERLASAGVGVTLLDEPGMFHGFLGFAATVPAAAEAADVLLATVRSTLH